MPRTQAEIWDAIQANNAEAMALQDEMNATVTPEPPEPPEPQPDALPKHASEPKGVIEVQPGNIEQGYKDIQDGQTLLLNNGDYGDFTFDRKFNEGITIRSKNSLKARIMGRWLFHKGEGHWVYDVEVATPANKLGPEKGAIVFCSNFIITKCKISAVCGVFGISNGNPDSNSSSAGPFTPAHDFYVGWNDFCGINSGGMNSASHVKLRLWDGKKDSAPEFYDFAVYDNSFFDNDKDGNNSCNEVFNFYIGNTKVIHPDSYMFPGGRILRNVALKGNNRRFLYFKCGVEEVIDNLCEGGKSTAFTQRHGWGTKWWGNKDSRGGGESAIFGGGRLPEYNEGKNDIRGNDFAGSVSIRCGTSNNGAVYNQACDYGLMVGNKVKGTTTIGKKIDKNHPLDNTQGGKVDHFTLLNHTGPVDVLSENIDDNSCTIKPNDGPGNYEVPPTTTVTPEQVGLKG